MSTHPSFSPERVTHKPALLAIVLASYLMIVLDISIVITGLPKIRDSLGLTNAGLSWVHNAYTLAFGGLLLVGARAGDVFGRKRMFMLGLGLFTLASLAIGLTASPAAMVTARAVQGMGAAVLAPSTLALLSVHFAEGPERNRALGWYGAVAGIGASVGMVLGGVLADLMTWRLGFFINLPIGLLLLWGAHRCMTETPRRKGRLDVPGALLSTLGMVGVVYGLVHAAHDGWGHPASGGSVLAGLVLLALFLRHEASTGEPLLPLRLFSNRSRTGAYVGRLLFLGGMIGFWFYTTQYLQGVMGMTPMQAGLAYLPATMVQFAVALSVPRLTARFGNDRLLVAGLAWCAAGMAWLSQVSIGTPYLTGIALPMLLIGAGQGAALSPLTVAGVSGVPTEDAGAASGLVNVFHQLGGSLGLSLLVLVYSLTGLPGSPPRVDLAHRIAASLGTGAAMLVLSLVVVLAFVVRRPVAVRPAD